MSDTALNAIYLQVLFLPDLLVTVIPTRGIHERAIATVIIVVQSVHNAFYGFMYPNPLLHKLFRDNLWDYVL